MSVSSLFAGWIVNELSSYFFDCVLTGNIYCSCHIETYIRLELSAILTALLLGLNTNCHCQRLGCYMKNSMQYIMFTEFLLLHFVV